MTMPHCWHGTGMTRQGDNHEQRQVCCHCGLARKATATEAGRLELHGPHLPKHDEQPLDWRWERVPSRCDEAPPFRPKPGELVLYEATDGYEEGLLLVLASEVQDEPFYDGPEETWEPVVYVSGWVFRREHDGARWVEKVPHKQEERGEPRWSPRIAPGQGWAPVV